MAVDLDQGKQHPKGLRTAHHHSIQKKPSVLTGTGGNHSPASTVNLMAIAPRATTLTEVTLIIVHMVKDVLTPRERNTAQVHPKEGLTERTDTHPTVLNAPSEKAASHRTEDSRNLAEANSHVHRTLVAQPSKRLMRQALLKKE